MLVGVDLVSVERVRRLLTASGRARSRVFAPLEILYCESKGVAKWSHYASRFAAKEAVMKALGSGWRGSLGFHEIAVVPGPLGRPELRLPRAVLAVLEQRGLHDTQVSLSHDAAYGFATVVFS